MLQSGEGKAEECQAGQQRAGGTNAARKSGVAGKKLVAKLEHVVRGVRLGDDGESGAEIAVVEFIDSKGGKKPVSKVAPLATRVLKGSVHPHRFHFGGVVRRGGTRAGSACPMSGGDATVHGRVIQPRTR